MKDKKICCFPNVAYLSETSRMLTVYKELKNLGVDACLATHGGTYEFVIQQENISYQIVDPVMDKERCREYVLKNTPQDGIRSAINLHFYRSTEELKRFVVSEAEFFQKNNIKVVLSGFTLSNALSCRLAGVHYAVTHLGSFVPPVMERKMIPPRQDFSFIADILPRSWIRWLINRMYLRSSFYTKQFKIVAKEVGVEPIRTTMDLFMGDITFITDVPEILGIPQDDIENWVPTTPSSFSRYPPRLKYAGAMFAQAFGSIETAVIEHLKTDKPKIYVALTSSRKEWLDMVFNALKEINATIVFVTTTHSDWKEKSKSPHIMFKDFLPSHEIMPLVDLAIIHGGQGSVQTAIASGTPIIGFPLQTEQFFNLKVIENHGAGICMSIKKLKRGQLQQAIEKILSDPSFKTSMEKLKTFQKTRDGPKIVAKELNNILKFIS